MIFASFLDARLLSNSKSEEISGVTKGKTASILYFSIVLLSYAYSVFLPLKLDTIWFIIVLLTYLPVISLLITGLMNFANAPADALVTKGAYRISRKPSYVSAFFVNIGIGIAGLSWTLLIAIADFLLLRYYVISVEEPFLLKNYGDAYREYVNRTSRWMGIPRSEEKDYTSI